MPHYEYECTKCGKHFEYFQKMSDAPIEACESCGGHLQKLLSAGSGLIFKGSGFYITDYKGKSPSAESAGASDSAGKAGGGESAPKADAGKSSTDVVPKPAKTENKE